MYLSTRQTPLCVQVHPGRVCKGSPASRKVQERGLGCTVEVPPVGISEREQKVLTSGDGYPLIDGRREREVHAESLDVDEREWSGARVHVRCERNTLQLIENP
jgi:hypothetical protein